MSRRRSRRQSRLTSQTILNQINPKNKLLHKDFLDYLKVIERSEGTIYNYNNDLNIFWCWNYTYNEDKYFPDLTKRDVARLQGHALQKWGWSPNRVVRFKATLNSLSRFIENMMDDEIKDYTPVVKSIDDPVKKIVRTKTVLTEGQVQYLLDELVNKRKYQEACVVALAAYSGVSKSELLRFKVEYFDSENIIYNALYKTPEKIRAGRPGSKRGKPMYRYVLLDFKKYFDLWMAVRKGKGIKSPWLFVSYHGKAGYKQAQVSMLNRVASECSDILGVPFQYHSLRHFLDVSMVAKYNLPQSVVQDYLGWDTSDLIDVYKNSDISDTFGNYFNSGGDTSVKIDGFSNFISDEP